MPLLHLLAGPNGAGKSSYVRDVLTPATLLPVINADGIAAERWPNGQAEHAYEAAQLAKAQGRDRIAKGSSFISEIVFSQPSKIELVSDAVDAGYLVHLQVVMVPIELTVQRVLEHALHGGHTRQAGHHGDPAARYFGTSEEFWMNLQSDYELRLERRALPDRSRRSRGWASPAHLAAQGR